MKRRILYALAGAVLVPAGFALAGAIFLLAESAFGVWGLIGILLIFISAVGAFAGYARGCGM